MAWDGVPEEVRQFIFEYIDSVEQLDVLLLLRSQRERDWSLREISDFLRTNPTSVANRIASLKALDLLEPSPDDVSIFRYKPKNSTTEKIIDALAEVNKVRRHTILGLIFSSLKRARNFADAFRVRGSTKEGDGDG